MTTITDQINKKTKIVCTIGPATTSVEMLSKLLKAGMNVMRMNFSHGDFAEHQEKVDNFRKAVKATGIPAALFQDLGGPKIRLGEFGTESGRVTIKNGAKFTLTTDKVVGDENRCHINYPKLVNEVKVGHHIMLDDGKKKLVVLEIKGKDIVCKVLAGGELKGRRGANFPDTDLTISSLTDKDKADIAFGLKNKVDFFALSFVRRPSDVEELRAILNKAKSKAGIISKIETPQAVEHIDEIIALSDAIMVARGDLAVEIPAEQVPLAQKMMIRKCNEVGKPVITATQMLESMIKSPVPTRAEVSDVANAIIDGTDAIMLSEETTLGDFPVEAVEMMSKIANHVESESVHEQLLLNGKMEPAGVGESINSSAVKTAERVDAKYLVSFTESGYGARHMSRHKPHKAIFVFTPNEVTYRQICLSYGCLPVMSARTKDFNVVLKDVRSFFLKEKIAKKGDRVVLASAMPFGTGLHTNMIVVETL